MKILLLISFFVVAVVNFSEAFNICTCQCCYSGICLDRPNSAMWNGTFQVSGCEQCTKALCFEVIKKPEGNCDEVSATCVDYDTYWRLTVIVGIITMWFALFIIGSLRDFSFFQKAWNYLMPGATPSSRTHVELLS